MVPEVVLLGDLVGVTKDADWNGFMGASAGGWYKSQVGVIYILRCYRCSQGCFDP